MMHYYNKKGQDLTSDYGPVAFLKEETYNLLYVCTDNVL